MMTFGGRDHVVQELLQIIQRGSFNTDVRRPKADGALEKLLQNIIDVGIIALDEEQAVAAYSAGAKAMDRVLLRIAK